MIEEFVDVEAGSVAKVENERVPEGLSADVVGLVVCQQFEEFLVDGVCVEEIFSNLRFKVWIVFDKNCLAAECLSHGSRSWL